MEWISEVTERFAAALYPGELKRRAAVAELRSAGVSESTVSSLYPQEHFPHAALVSSLLEEDSFAIHARIPANDIHLRQWLSLTPSRMRWSLSQSLPSSYTSRSSVIFYDRSDPQNYHVLLQSDATQEQLASTMLLLPIALDVLHRFPFADPQWSITAKSILAHKLEAAERPLRNLLALTEAQVPLLRS